MTHDPAGSRPGVPVWTSGGRCVTPSGGQRCAGVTTQQNDPAGEVSALVAGLLTVVSLLIAALAALLSLWLAPAAGAALLALGWFGLRTRVPAVLALITIAFGLVLLALGALAFLPA